MQDEADVPMQGNCASGWEQVANAFRENITNRRDLGANLCIRHKGEVVVDLAGGWFDDERTRLFAQDDLALVFSTTKGMTAIAAHYLADRGLLDLDAPVVEYWPEYGQKCKDRTTVAMMLNHSAGVPGFHEPLRRGSHCDWDYMVDRVAAEEPFWEPGLRGGYHAMNFGWTVGEVVRRVAGQSLGQFFREKIAEPLGADFWIGLPEEEEHRVSRLRPDIPGPGDPVTEVHTNIFDHPTSISALTLINTSGFEPFAAGQDGEFAVNTREVHAAEIGAAGGIGSGRGICRVYAALGQGLVSREQVERMSTTSMVSHRDAVLLIPTRFSLGFMKSMDNRQMPLGNLLSFIIGHQAFGHVGYGGSFGLYDPVEDLAIGYAVRRLHTGVLLDERGQSLVDATYLSLGYRTNAPGVWIR